MIKGLHHNAYRCRDAEETRKFYEDFLGLPLVNAFEITETKSGRQTHVLHLFFQMDDGSCLAFFECPDMPFDFKEQHDFDLHIALEVKHDVLEPMLTKGRAAGLQVRGISDHGMIDSIYFRDPNGYVIELTAKRPDHDEHMDPARNSARANLDKWQREKPSFAKS
jgi:catechol 2,3-dioxygenase-like lactoylglutathione lyase family enzyme